MSAECLTFLGLLSHSRKRFSFHASPFLNVRGYHPVNSPDRLGPIFPFPMTPKRSDNSLWQEAHFLLKTCLFRLTGSSKCTTPGKFSLLLRTSSAPARIAFTRIAACFSLTTKSGIPSAGFSIETAISQGLLPLRRESRFVAKGLPLPALI